MNRFKRELRKHGQKLECDYPTMPFYLKGKSPFDVGNICIEGIVANAENCTVTTFYNVIVCREKVNRDFTFTEIAEDDGNPTF